MLFVHSGPCFERVLFLERLNGGGERCSALCGWIACFKRGSDETRLPVVALVWFVCRGSETSTWMYEYTVWCSYS